MQCSAAGRQGAADSAVAYAVATIPIALRNFVPELMLDLALVLLGASVIWLALWMLLSKGFQPEAYRGRADVLTGPTVRPVLVTP